VSVLVKLNPDSKTSFEVCNGASIKTMYMTADLQQNKILVQIFGEKRQLNKELSRCNFGSELNSFFAPEIH